MFCVEEENGTRHKFHNEKYARGFLKATYNDKIAQLKANKERYEILNQILNRNDFKIIVKDKSRLYFLNRESDVKIVNYTGIIKRQISGSNEKQKKSPHLSS